MKNIARLFRVLGRWKWHYLTAGFLLILSTLLRMTEPKILQIVVDGILSSGNHLQSSSDYVARFLFGFLPDVATVGTTRALWGAALLFAILAVFQALTQFIAGIMASNSTERAIKHLRDRLFAHIQALPLSAIDKVPRGEMIQRCTGDVETVRSFIGTQIIELIRLLAIFGTAFYMMSVVHLPYTFIAVSMFLPIVLSSYFFFIKEQKVWKQHEEEQDKLTTIIQENLSGIRVVQAFAQQNRESERFHRQNEEKRKIGIKHINLHTIFWPISDTLVILQVVLTVVVGAYFTFNQQISTGEFAAFFTYGIMVTWPMRSIGRIVSQLGMALVAMERMREILDMLEEDYSGETYEETPIRGAIEFRNVSFAYPAKEGESQLGKRYALQNISFKIEAGERIALMGPTGAGKSTIIALLARFYEPDTGEILLDGKPLASYNKAYLRSRLGIVHQKAFLFSTTLRNNINYAQNRIQHGFRYTDTLPDDVEIKTALEDVSIGDFIDKLSEGLDTIVGEKGVTLSGGQKQRVALARTLLGNPAILVLDDATSAVDTETEFNIQQALLKRMTGKTTFIIAHRMTSVQNAHRIFVFDKGQLVEQGTQSELLKKSGFFKQVYDIQVSLEH